MPLYLRRKARSVGRTLVWAAAAAALGVAAPAAAHPAAAFMPLGDPAPAPLAFLGFCARMPAECAPPSQDPSRALAAEDMAIDAAAASGAAPLAVGALGPEAAAPSADRSVPEAPPAAAATAAADPAAPAPLALTRALRKELTRVNRRINAAISPRPDLQTQGVADRWDLPLEEGLTSGDCEDYVLEKRRALIAEGVPAEALSIAVALTRWGELHAVLLVSTDRGELVLDSLSPWVTPWNRTGYRWIERQAPGRTFDWVSVAG